MELRERIAAVRPFPEESLDDAFVEVRDRVHAELIADLGPQLADADIEPAAAARAGPRAGARAPRGGARSVRRRPRPPGRRDHRRHARPRADREAPGRRLDHRDHGQRRRATSGSSAAAACTRPACASPTRRICGASSRRSPARSAAASTSPRRCSTPGFPTAAASTRCSRRCRSPGSLLTIRKFGRERFSLDDMVRLGTLTREAVELLQACLHAELNILDLRRHGLGQDDAAQRDVGRDPETTSGSSRSRTPPSCGSTSARAPARGAAGEHRGRGAGHDPRPGPQRAAHAARPHRRRRGPRRRGAGHAPGDEHGPRRLAEHGPRELGAGRAGAHRDDGPHGRLRPAGPRDPPAGRLGARPHRPHRAAAPTARGASRPSPRCCAWRATSSPPRISSRSRSATSRPTGTVLGELRWSGLHPVFAPKLERRGVKLPGALNRLTRQVADLAARTGSR